jgi:hypothetical protein
MMKLARKVVACLAASALEAEALLPLAAKAACSRSKPKMLDEGFCVWASARAVLKSFSDIDSATHNHYEM